MDWEELKTEFEKNDKIILYFYSKYCRPCTIVSPTIEKYEKQYESIKVIKINTEDPDNKTIINAFSITGIPKLYLINKSVIKKVLSGYKPDPHYKSAFEWLLKKN